jgi:prepilin-type N-terminal cleavage/methylation domain-containing protein
MKKNGFTLIESAIALVILGLIVTLLVPPLVDSVRHEKLHENKDALISLRHALVDIARERGRLPASLDEAGLPEQDTWGSPYTYLAMDADICSQNAGGFDMTLEIGQSAKAVFLIASPGPNRWADAVYEIGAEIKLSERGDDLVEFMSLDQLKYHACR